MLITPLEPSEAFNLKDPTLREVQEVVKAARTNSAPGPSEVPYVVYKNGKHYGKLSSGGGGKWRSRGDMQRVSGFLRGRTQVTSSSSGSSHSSAWRGRYFSALLSDT